MAQPTNECVEVFYLQQISDFIDKLLFKTPWGSIIVRNCNAEGGLLEFKNKNEYLISEKNLWLNLQLKVFRENGELYPVFCCPECPSMKGFKSLNTDTRTDQFLPLLCIHSRTVSFLLKDDWDSIWNIDIDDNDEAHELFCNRNIVALTLHEKNERNDGFFLAATMIEGKIYILYTVTKRQNVSICSGHSCPLSHCAHQKKYIETIARDDYVLDFDPFFRNNRNEEVVEAQPDEQQSIGLAEEENATIDEDENVSLASEGAEVADFRGESNTHYMNELSEKEYTKMCGFNCTKIPYPFKNSESQQQLYIKQIMNESDFPNSFVPPYSESKTCEHEFLYDSDDQRLVRESANVIIFNEIGEQCLDIEVLARKTVGNCKCLQHFDGHGHFLWHLGHGKFVSYRLLVHYLHLWVNDGTPKFAFFKSIKDNANSHGISSTMTYNDLHRATVGFFRQLQFDERKAFSCPLHGSNPKWINTDGKYLGPTKKKCFHLKELDRAECDDEVLEQSTKFKDRVFLPKHAERKEVVRLLSGNHTTEKAHEFLDSDVVESPNGQLVKNLIDYIEQKYPGELPSKYKRFIQNICKPTSVRGFIQVTNFTPLDILRSYCNEELDVKNIENIEDLRDLQEEMPVLWPMLDDICTLEGSSFLPREVAEIVIKLLDIRKDTFINAKSRDEVEYIPYDGQEHPTMCYPNNKLLEHPKKYKVNSRKDKDLCEKAFKGHKDFTAGIFSLGCACTHNITLGFELMLNNESPKNLFRLLKCRDINLDQVEGILMDSACIQDSYIMNREADMLEWKRLLVDGAHWRAMKKFKATNSKGKGGHIGCSEGFNWNLYKPFIKEKVNSQGREQLHSLINKCSESLRLMSYSNFMIFMKVFFAITNLRNRNGK